MRKRERPPSLLGPDEDVQAVPYVVNEVVPMDPAEVAAIEERAWKEEGQRRHSLSPKGEREKK